MAKKNKNEKAADGTEELLPRSSGATGLGSI